MTAGERFRNWIDEVAQLWADRLGRWAGTFIGAGIDAFFKILGKSAAPKLKPLLDMLEATGEVPSELKPLIDELKDPTGEVAAMFANSAGGAMIGGALGKITDALFNPLGYSLGNLRQNSLLSTAHYITAWLRGDLSLSQLNFYLHHLNLSDTQIGILRGLSSARLDPLTAIRAEWRGIISSDMVKRMLNDQGIRDADVATLKEVSKIFPTPRDYVGFLAHEVFEPDMIAKYGLLSEWDKIDKEPAKKIGLMEDELKLYWMDHWQHPDWGTIRELRHRDQIKDQDVRDWFRMVEYPEYWRPKMLNVLWSLPNRIEIRMMARYLDMSKAEIMDLLKKAGLAEEFRADAADFMMIMGLTGYWSSMLSKGWMSPGEVKADIDARGFKPVTAERIYKRLVSVDKPERTAPERDLTKTDIYKGIKADRITREQGMELLVDLGFDEAEADVLLDTNVPEDITDKVVEARLLSKTDIRTGFLAEIIPESQARVKLLDLRYSTADTDLLIRIFKAAIKPEKIEEARDLTKSDTLRLFKLAIIGEAEARIMLGDLNYKPEDVESLLAANMPPVEEAKIEEARQLTKADIKTGLRTKLLAVPEVQVRLEALGYSPADATLLIALYQRVDSLRPSVQPKEASKADIVLGVKKGLLTQEEGYGMLLDLDFSPEASAFILTVRTEETPFSPVNFAEFKERTQKYRRAAGMGVIEMPEEIKTAAAEVVKLTGDVEALERSIAEEKRGIIAGEPIPEAATKRLKTLQVKRNRAISTLAAAKSEYDRLVAEWRHALP